MQREELESRPRSGQLVTFQSFFGLLLFCCIRAPSSYRSSLGVAGGWQRRKLSFGFSFVRLGSD